MFKLEITGESVSELRSHAIYVATHMLTTEELVSILDMRADALADPPAPAKPAARRGRPPKAIEAPPLPMAAPMTDPPTVVNVAPAAAAAQLNAAEAAGNDTKPQGPTRADVIVALDAYATKNPEGQAGARAVMEKVTGQIALNKVPQAQFASLIAALSTPAAA
jgi:hypothetical protein